jgi:GxxExxY protein
MDQDRTAFTPVPAAAERVAAEIIGAAIEVHRALGPGFLERIYQEALCLELHARGMRFERERAITVEYRGVALPGQRIDLLVADLVVVELKASNRADYKDAQLLSYLRSTGLRLGLLLNFHCLTMKEGIRRVVL